jgi:hypothetical protein
LKWADALAADAVIYLWDFNRKLMIRRAAA